MLTKIRKLYPQKTKNVRKSKVKLQPSKSSPESTLSQFVSKEVKGKLKSKTLHATRTGITNVKKTAVNLQQTNTFSKSVAVKTKRISIGKAENAKDVKISKKVESVMDAETTDEENEEVQDLEMKLGLDTRDLKKTIRDLITFTSNKPKLKNKLFDDEHFPIFVQINIIKISEGHSKIIRIPLKHSLLTADSEVCLIVSDVKGIPNKKHEEHLAYYEKLLSKKGVDNIKKIMTFHEFRTEYETFELRSRLVELYDAFLVEGKISGKTVRKCGKIFYKKRKVPTSIKLQVSKLKEHVEQTLKKTALYFHTKSDSFVVQVGHSKMTVGQLLQNISDIIKGLEKELPGGFGNVRNLNICTFGGLAVPIYTTLKSQNEVVISNDQPKSPVTFKGELSTRLNSGVEVTPTGDVTVYKLKKRKSKTLEVNKSSMKRRKINKRSKDELSLNTAGKKKKKVKGKKVNEVAKRELNFKVRDTDMKLTTEAIKKKEIMKDDAPELLQENPSIADGLTLKGDLDTKTNIESKKRQGRKKMSESGESLQGNQKEILKLNSECKKKLKKSETKESPDKSQIAVENRKQNAGGKKKKVKKTDQQQSLPETQSATKNKNVLQGKDVNLTLKYSEKKKLKIDNNESAYEKSPKANQIFIENGTHLKTKINADSKKKKQFKRKN